MPTTVLLKLPPPPLPTSTPLKDESFDDVIDEYEIKVVDRDRLEFPKFSDYAFC
jgi:hypothetical protein